MTAVDERAEGDAKLLISGMQSLQHEVAKYNAAAQDRCKVVQKCRLSSGETRWPPMAASDGRTVRATSHCVSVGLTAAEDTPFLHWLENNIVRGGGQP